MDKRTSDTIAQYNEIAEDYVKKQTAYNDAGIEVEKFITVSRKPRAIARG